MKRGAETGKGEDAPKKPATAKEGIGDDDHSHEPLGLLAGDVLHLVECDDFRPDEVVIEWDIENKEWQAWRFEEYVEDAEWGKCPSVAGDEDPLHNPAEFRFYRVTSIERRITVERPTDAEGETALRRQEIKALRDRLDDIDADDITNCTARLALKKHIFDLEHPKDLEDWSAWEERERR